MRHRDFFAYCAGLKPAEQKTMSELSWVRHLAEGDILYGPGEPGNALYVVTRGVLEVLPGKDRQAAPMSFARGDLVGHLELFADTPRTQSVRAREVSTLQCFPRANFPELLRLVPSFFKFICEEMAGRLLRERDSARRPEKSLELSGRISNFDLTTIHQTIMNAGQTGELVIKSEHAEAIGAFYYEAGVLRAGRFLHLTGEEAFWQLFQVEKFPGTFSFSAGELPPTDWIECGRIAQNSGDLLITALQFRDELDALKKGMHDGAAPLATRGGDLVWSGAAPKELKPLAGIIWQLLEQGPHTIADVYRQCGVSELKIYQVVSELIYSDQASFLNEGALLAPELI